MTNNTIDIMLAHRSIRSFTDRTVSDENLKTWMLSSVQYKRPQTG